MTIPSYTFSTEGINLPAGLATYPLWFQSESNNFDLQEQYWLDYQVAVQEMPTAAGRVKVFRRYQTHFFPSPDTPPQIIVNLSSNISVKLIWYSLTIAYQQNEAPTHTAELEQELLTKGTYNGKNYRRFWSPSDKAVQATLLNIRYNQKDYDGEPTRQELALLLKQKALLAPAIPTTAVNDPIDSSIIGTSQPSIPDPKVDVRAYRPITAETVSQVPADILRRVSQATSTADQLALDIVEELIEKPEVGVTRSFALDSKEITQLPGRADARDGVELFNKTIERYKSGELDVIPASEIN